jgi:hypothetical protein
MKANEGLKALVGARDKANLLLEAAHQRIKDLEVKKDALEGGGSGPTVAVSTAAEKKRGIIARFVLGEVGKEEVSSARTAFERARRNEEEAKEMIEALDDAIADINRELPAPGEGIRRAEAALWGRISEDLKEEAVRLAGDLVAKAYAAGSGGPFEQWLGNVFKASGQASYMGNSFALRQQIEQEYLGK